MRHHKFGNVGTKVARKVPFACATFGVVILAACSGGSGGSGVSQGQVQTEIATQIAAQSPGTTAPKVVCPAGLPNKVGAVMDCEATSADSTRNPVHVVVDSTANNTVHFVATIGNAGADPGASTTADPGASTTADPGASTTAAP